jgi:hypothetical protein
MSPWWYANPIVVVCLMVVAVALIAAFLIVLKKPVEGLVKVLYGLAMVISAMTPWSGRRQGGRHAASRQAQAAASEGVPDRPPGHLDAASMAELTRTENVPQSPLLGIPIGVGGGQVAGDREASPVEEQQTPPSGPESPPQPE